MTASTQRGSRVVEQSGSCEAANIFRFENGKVVEIWNDRDDFGLLEQIGSPIHAGAAPDA